MVKQYVCAILVSRRLGIELLLFVQCCLGFLLRPTTPAMIKKKTTKMHFFSTSIQGSGFRVQGLGHYIWGLWFRLIAKLEVPGTRD